MRGPGFGQHVVKPVLLVGVDIDLVAQIAGIADPLHQRLIGADVDGAGVHETQRRGRYVRPRAGGEHVPGLWTGNLEADPLGRNILKPEVVVCQMLLEPAHVVGL